MAEDETLCDPCRPGRRWVHRPTLHRLLRGAGRCACSEQHRNSEREEHAICAPTFPHPFTSSDNHGHLRYFNVYFEVRTAFFSPVPVPQKCTTQNVFLDPLKRLDPRTSTWITTRASTYASGHVEQGHVTARPLEQIPRGLYPESIPPTEPAMPPNPTTEPTAFFGTYPRRG